jgi:pseudaminic acid synthase
MRIGPHPVGEQHPVFIVAEISANHRQSLDNARQLVRAAATAGADAVKLQTYTPDTITIDADGEPFRIQSGTVWDGQTLYSLYAEAHTPWEWHEDLQHDAEAAGLVFFSSPFDRSAVDFLDRLGVPAFKIASFEITDIGLIQRVAQTGKPMIISTGMATLEEIEEAVAAARNAGASEIALLKCTSAYPAPAAEANLRTMDDLRQRFAVPVGLSDHTIGTAVSVTAVALGASIVEKHLTLARANGGPDAAFSSEPQEFAEMVRQIREAEAALGRVSYEATAHESGSRILRRSLFVVADMAAGDEFTEDNVRSIRPGHGLHTRHLPEVLGRHASREIPRGTPLQWDLVT